MQCARALIDYTNYYYYSLSLLVLEYFYYFTQQIAGAPDLRSSVSFNVFIVVLCYIVNTDIHVHRTFPFREVGGLGPRAEDLARVSLVSF